MQQIKKRVHRSGKTATCIPAGTASPDGQYKTFSHKDKGGNPLIRATSHADALTINTFCDQNPDIIKAMGLNDSHEISLNKIHVRIGLLPAELQQSSLEKLTDIDRRSKAMDNLLTQLRGAETMLTTLSMASMKAKSDPNLKEVMKVEDGISHLENGKLNTSDPDDVLNFTDAKNRKATLSNVKGERIVSFHVGSQEALQASVTQNGDVWVLGNPALLSPEKIDHLEKILDTVVTPLNERIKKQVMSINEEYSKANAGPTI